MCEQNVPPQTMKLSPETEQAMCDLGRGQSGALLQVRVSRSSIFRVWTDGPVILSSPPKRRILVPLYAIKWVSIVREWLFRLNISFPLSNASVDRMNGEFYMQQSYSHYQTPCNY
jgi:hypothetical protein